MSENQKTAGKLIIKRSPRSDSVCDFIMMDANLNNGGGYNASLSLEQCDKAIAIMQQLRTEYINMEAPHD